MKDNIKYFVKIVNVDGEIQEHIFSNIDDVDELVIEVNNNPYWNIQKIEKFTQHEFKYDNIVIHKPLYFSLDNITEADTKYSFLIKDNSLTNVTRTS